MKIKEGHYLAPYVATPSELAPHIMELTKPKKGDRFADIGCGEEGVMVIEAAKLKYGLKEVIGIEGVKDRIKKVTKRVRDLGLEDRIKIIHADAVEYNLSKIKPNIVFMYLTYNGVTMLKPKLESEVEIGTRVVSEAYEVGGWKPSRAVTLNYKNRKKRDVFVYEIGKTEMREPLELQLEEILIKE